MSNQKQAPTGPQLRYSSSFTQRPTPSQRADFHVTAQQQYAQQPNPSGNQGSGIRAGMAQTGPPTQASTPPNSELKVQQQMNQPMNMSFVQQTQVRGTTQNYYSGRQHAGPPQNQTQRMTNHRQIQGQQPVFQQQTTAPYMPVPQVQPAAMCYLPYPYTSGQRPMVPQFFSNQYTTLGYPPAQPPTPTFLNYAQYLPRPQAQQVQSVQQNITQAPPPQLAANLAPTQQQVYKKKRRDKAIPIIDPSTGKDKLSEVYDEDDSHPPSGESSARQTPQPTYIPNKEVQNAFTKQVNMVINQDKLDELDHAMIPVEAHIDTQAVYQTATTAVHSSVKNDLVQYSTKLQVPTKEFVPASIAGATPKEMTTPIVSANVDVPECTIKKPKDRDSPVKGKVPRDQPAREKEIKQATPLVAEKSVKDENRGAKEESKELAPPVAAVPVAPPFTKDVAVVVVKSEDKKSAKKEKVEQKFTPPQDVNAGVDATINASSAVPAPDNGKAKQKNRDGQKTAPQGGFKQTATAPVPPSQPSKPTNKTNKMRELNIKGANKEGTDMDAFSDSLTAADTVIVANPNTNGTINDNNSNDINFVSDFESMKINEANDSATIKIESKPLPKSKIDVTDIVKDIPRPFVAPVEVVDETDRANLTNEKLVQAKNEANSKGGSCDSNNYEVIEPKPSPNLPYKEDQWSPLNPDGKKVYDRDFLMALRNDPKSKLKPDNLLDSVVQDDRGRVGDISRYPMGGRSTDFAPAFSAPNYSGKSSSQRGAPPKRNSQQGKISGNAKNNNKPSILRLSIREDVKLHEVENAWKPARFSSISMTEDEKKTETLYKKVRGILNKLTPQKFDSLLAQIKSLPIDTTERLQGVIDLVFEKAVDEPAYSAAYANMCNQLALMQVASAMKKDDFVNFRKLLITRCQLEFEKNSADESSRNARVKEIEACTDPEKKKELNLLLEDEDRRLRRKSVGNIRFIGELFKNNMLTNKIMTRCLDNLLQTKDEENLECLCKLLTTVGEELEKRSVSLIAFFTTIKDIVDNKYKISSRVRFMLQDVIDLRANKWIPRRQDNNPKTMDQIQKEAHDEQQNILAMNSGPHTPRKDDRNASQSDRKRRNNVSDNEGWTTSQSRGGGRTSSFLVQSDKLKTKTPQIDEPLGSSQMFGQWGRGSNLKTSVPSSLANMYAPLENIGNDIEKRNSMNYRSKDPYSSKGPSLERSYKHSYEDGRGSRSGSQHRSHESAQRNTSHSHSQSSISKIVPAPVVAKPAPAAEELSPEQFESKMKDVLEEYINDCCTIEQCEEDIKENIPPGAMSQLVSFGYIDVLDRSKTARVRTSAMFVHLIKLKSLSLEEYCLGLEEVLNQADDLTIDIPKIWEYLGEIVAPLLYENTLPLNKLLKSCSVLIDQGHAAKLLAPTFKLVISEKGPNHLTSICSSVSLSDFMPTEDVSDFIKNNQFEFLVGGNTSASQSALTSEQIHEKLLQFFSRGNSFDDIQNWVTVNIGERVKDKQFIRVLATAIFENSIVKAKLIDEILQNHYKLLLFYIDGNIELELEVLYALQAHMVKLEHPQGLYLGIFTHLYDDTILSHNSFVKWETSNDIAEQEGKGVALKQLTSFFTSLKEADDEESSSASEDA